jgi:peptide/nickel transport system permease protein
MLGFLIRRIIQSVFVMLAVALIAFMMFRFMGDPVNSMVSETPAPPNAMRCGRAWAWTSRFMCNTPGLSGARRTGDFGLSWRNARPVSSLLAERFPATAELVLVAAGSCHWRWACRWAS